MNPLPRWNPPLARIQRGWAASKLRCRQLFLEGSAGLATGCRRIKRLSLTCGYRFYWKASEKYRSKLAKLFLVTMAHESIVAALDDVFVDWQFVIHRCPRALIPTFREIFPELRSVALADCEARLLFIAVWQKTNMDMSGYSEPVEEERHDRTVKVRFPQFSSLLKLSNCQLTLLSYLTVKFIELGKKIAANVRSRCSNEAYWFDFIDPSSGIPVRIAESCF